MPVILGVELPVIAVAFMLAFWLLALLEFLARQVWAFIDDAGRTPSFFYGILCKRKKSEEYPHVYHDKTQGKIFRFSERMPEDDKDCQKMRIDGRCGSDYDVWSPPSDGDVFTGILLLGFVAFFVPFILYILWMVWPLTLCVALGIGLLFTARAARRLQKGLKKHIGDKEAHNVEA